MSAADQHDEPWIRFLGRLGIEPKSFNEDNVLALCVFHGDVATPSLSVSSEGRFFCFSPACGAKGNGFAQLARRAGWDGKAGLDLVAAHGLEPYAAGKAPDRAPPKPVFVPTGRYHVDWAAMWQAWCRAEAPPDPEAAAAAAWLFGTRNIAPTALQRMSVGVDREAQTVVFPQHVLDDGHRTCVGVSYRSLTGKAYITKFDKRNHLWGLPSDDRLPMVLVEGQMDCLRIRSADPLLGTCAYGAQLSEAQHRMARLHPGGVVLFMDDDAAGVAATRKSLAAIGPERCRVVVEYHGVKDAGDMTDAQIIDSIAGAVPGAEYGGGLGQRMRMRVLKGGR